MSNIGHIFTLVLSILICELAGIVGLIFSIYSKTKWYIDLKKPSFNLHYWVFGYIWIILYLLMGISLYIVWLHGIDVPKVALALKFFGIQLVLNAAWSIVLFGARSLFGGFIVALALLVSVITTVIMFFTISQTAALLLVPYLIWIGFTVLLSYDLWKLNKSPAESYG